MSEGVQMKVGDLEQMLFEAFPRHDAEPWDNPGLCVGDAGAVVEGIAFALDASAKTIKAAADSGCNVLVTHHPLFIGGGPTRFAPECEAFAPGAGRAVFEAIKRSVAVISMHTNADRSPRLRSLYVDLLGWECIGSFEHMGAGEDDEGKPGLGVVFQLPPGAVLGDVARRCAAAFSSCPRVWGESSRPVKRLALLNGSWSGQEVYDACMDNSLDCVIVGETKYHFCADAQPHLSIVDLGHDVSELPLVGLLIDVLAAAGLGSVHIVDLTQSAGNWWTACEEGK